MLWGESFIQRAMRVMRVFYRPTEKEFQMTMKIVGLGMVAIGLLGLLITTIFGFL